MAGWRETLRRLAPPVGLGLALVAGAALRLGFHGVIEWTGDAQQTFVHAQAMAAGGPWPAVGLPGSLGAPNPGLGLWVFGWLAQLGARTPPDLARAVQVLNVVALGAFAALGLAAIPRERREPWLWAAALWAASPASVILEREVWTPAVLPLPAVGMLWAWLYRRHTGAAFAWGLLGALIAQVDLAAGLFAAALAIWTLLADRRAFPRIGFVAGCIVGALPALPWAQQLASNGWQLGAPHHPSAGFYLRWPSLLLGAGPQSALGPQAFGDFLRGPPLNGSATQFAAVAQAALLAATAVLVLRTVQKLQRDGGMRARALLLGDGPETVLSSAACWGYGGMLTLTTFAGAAAYPTDMEVIAPIMALWTALFALWTDKGARRPFARPALVLLCAAQAALSLFLLAYIDRVGAIPGDFGVARKAQQAGVTRPVSAPAARPPRTAADGRPGPDPTAPGG